MRRGALLLLLLLWPAAVTATNAGATARVSQDVVEAGTKFQYQADASVRGAAELRVEKAPGFGVLQVVGQQKMPQIITINGVTERRLSLRYAVVASTEGEFKIAPPVFRVGNERITANSVTVTVVKAGAAPEPQAKRDSRYFIEATLDPDDRPPYVGEQLTLRYDLYVDGAQMDVQPANSKEPSLDDFWIQELTDRIARTDQMVTVNGRLYKRSSMWSYALFPLRAGPVQIEAANVELVTGGIFRRGPTAQIVSEAIDVDVQPLPPGAPIGFYEGNVGNWTFKVSTDQSVTKVGQAFVVEVAATGEGQVNRLRLPKLPAIEGTRVSDVDESSIPNIRGITVGGTSRTRYTITPLKQGKLTIGALEFSWFEPSRGEYKTTRSPPIVVQVAAGELGPAPIQPEKLARRTVAADEDLIENLLAELGPQRDVPNMDAAPDPARFPALYWFLIAASFGGLVWVSFGPRLRQFARRAAPERAHKQRTAHAIERLDDAGSDAATFARALREGLHEAWDIPLGAVTGADIERAFASRGLDTAVASELAEVLRECEAARFAPGGARLKPTSIQRARRALETLVAAGVILLALASPARAADWTEIARSNPDSVDVHFNVGTQAANDRDYATARLALERATYLGPWDSAVEHNRALVERIVRLIAIERSRTGRTMEGDETLFWWRTSTHVNPHVIGLLATAFWLLAALAIGIRRRSDSPAVRDAAVVGFILAVVLGVGATFGAVARNHVLRTTRPVVVMTSNLELREGPNPAAKLKRTPPAIVPGTLLRIVDERHDWVKITWPGDAAWIQKHAVRSVTEPMTD